MIDMGFMENVTIYKSETTRIYINQCHAKGRKTRLFAIRKDDKTGLAEYLAGIVWSWRWRQYVFQPESNMIWSSSCLLGIATFLQRINTQERRKWGKKQLHKKAMK